MEGGERIGELIIWDTEEGQISISEIVDGSVFEEHRIFGSVQEILMTLAEVEARVIGE
jgi:hypothetical protein